MSTSIQIIKVFSKTQIEAVSPNVNKDSRLEKNTQEYEIRKTSFKACKDRIVK